MIDSQSTADQRDRYRIALLALRGHEKLEIIGLLSVARSTAEDWAYRYRDGGIGAPKLRGPASQKLAARLDAGPAARDKVCTLRGKDVQRIIKEELNTDLSLSSVYRTLHALGYSCLAPRPRHEKQSLAAQKEFKEQSAPSLHAP